jgi:hypothetical protein
VNASRGKVLAWLGHPVTMAALALLVVNDHVLKHTHPGWATGKLSDAAGMLLAPPLLAALAGLIAPRLPVRRVAVASIVAVGAGFTFVKIWAYGAQLASSAWSVLTPSLIRADPTDLLVLPLLGVAWWTFARSRAARAGRLVRAIRLAVLLPLALAGVAATSPARALNAVGVHLSGDSIYLEVRDEYHDAEWSVSHDDGATWAEAEEPASPARAGCTAAQPVVCYRVVAGGLGVQGSTGGGPWTDSWRIGDAQRHALYRDYADIEKTSELTSVALAVREVPGGHVVVVANGRDGFAVRDTAGQWSRIGFPGHPEDRAPLPLRPADSGPLLSVPLALTLTSLLAGLMLTAAGVRSLRRAGASAHWWWLAGALPFTALLTVPPVAFAWAEPASIMAVPGYFAVLLAVPVSLACAGTATIASGRRAAWSPGWFGGAGGVALFTAAITIMTWMFLR